MDHEGKLRKSQCPAPVPRLRIIICNLKFPASDRNEVILTPMAEMSPQLLMQDLQSSVRSLPSITGSPKGHLTQSHEKVHFCSGMSALYQVTSGNHHPLTPVHGDHQSSPLSSGHRCQYINVPLIPGQGRLS